VLVDVLWTPLAGCKSSLRGVPEQDARHKLQLFWRSSVALCMMPLGHLASQSQRKRPFVEDLDAHLPPQDATPAEARLAHIRLNLPIFAMMVARMPTDGAKPKPPAAAVEPQEGAKASGVPVALSPLSGMEQAPCSDTEAREAATKVATEVVTEVATEEATEEATEANIETSTYVPWEPASAEKVHTAARHTYDVGYKKWEHFDVDAAERELDEPPRYKREKVNMSKMKEKMLQEHEDPVDALDAAIKKLKVDDPTPRLRKKQMPTIALQKVSQEVSMQMPLLPSPALPLLVAQSPASRRPLSRNLVQRALLWTRLALRTQRQCPAPQLQAQCPRQLTAQAGPLGTSVGTIWTQMQPFNAQRGLCTAGSQCELCAFVS
jgi:hypothetical protein